MPINQPYDPRYKAKIFVPKLTEEERRARATPLENLRSLRFRAETPAAPVDVPVPAESVAQAPATRENAAPEAVPVLAPASASDCRPTALEVLLAEFPEIFAPQGKQHLSEAHADDERPLSAGHMGHDAPWGHPRHSRAYVRSRYTALRPCETGRRSVPVPVHMDVGKEVEGTPYILRNQAYLTPGRGSIVDLMRRAYSARRASAAFSPGQRPGKSSQLSFSP
ncbi:MAG: hypothetical protein JNK74_06125 [Candidatus Hydrogenedentes bacterium]|nr:hypothetical protein [Candidatus Hydrogenedentota bacterium]